MLLLGPKDRDTQPQSVVGANPYWVRRGLKSLYSLAPGCWRINQVTGAVGGAPAGSGVTFRNGRLVTPGSVGNGATLAHGLATNIALPVTFFCVSFRITAGANAWSLLRNNAANVWYGWYSGGFTQIVTTDANSFDGTIQPGGGTSAAWTHESATLLRGAGQRASSLDATATAPTGVNATTVALGWTRLDDPNVYGGQAGETEFNLWGALQGSLNNAELASIARNPWQLFAPLPRKIWVPVSAGGAVTTTTSLSAAIQAAQTATASVSAAIQASRSGTADIAAAIQIARTAQASIDGAIQSAQTATAAASAAILQANTATTSLTAYIQAGSTASASVDAAIQVSRSGTATLDAAIQRAVTATASLGAAVQAASTATASLNAYIQAGTSASAALDAAIQAARSATANLSAAISVARTASASLGAAIAVTSSVSAAVDAAVLASRSGQISLSAYISDPSVTDTNSAWWTYTVPADDLTYSVAADDLTYSIGTTTLAGAQT